MATPEIAKLPEGPQEKIPREGRRLPLGAAKELEATKETLPAVEIKNHVVWVNPAFEGKLPFEIEEGRPIKLGMFLAPKAIEGARRLEASTHHGRSAILGRVVFEDKDGNRWRDIDVKGIGNISQIELSVEKVEISKQKGESMGLLRLASAYKDAETAEMFLKLGIRTCRPIAIILLEEIVDENGNKVSIEEGENRGVIAKNMKPVVEVRAWTTKSRVDDLRSGRGFEVESKPYLADAIELVSAELGVENMTKSDYLKWFAETLGKQVGLMHKNGWFHGYITAHNITLDCRIVDLDSVDRLEIEDTEEKITRGHRIWGDKLSANGVVDSLQFNMRNADGDRFNQIFREAYKKALGSSE